jgi:ubiquinol-cytochrome c reductase cytochrome c1 subunit
LRLKYFFLLIVLLPFFCLGSPDELPITLEQVKVDVLNRASVLRGAKFFAQNCMVCHSMKYLGLDPIAKEAGITLDKMPLKNQQWWLNVVPPDLSLIANQYSPDWLFTYFHSFYKDPSRPTGYNNLVANNVNMMNIFAQWQGEQELMKPDEENVIKFGPKHYYSMLKLVKSGTMSPEEFDETMTDVVNFLVYAAEPSRVKREQMGIWVLLFLAILLVLAYLLKKAYWKDIE